MSDKRFNEAVEAARQAFWATFAQQYPEIQTGDLSPSAVQDFDSATQDAALEWLASNQPS